MSWLPHRVEALTMRLAGAAVARLRRRADGASARVGDVFDA